MRLKDRLCRSVLLALVAFGVPLGMSAAQDAKPEVINPQTLPSMGCMEMRIAKARYVVCQFDPEAADLRLFLQRDETQVYGSFDHLSAALESKGERLRFAMNAGMYHRDRSPVGLYIEDGHRHKRANTNEGPGNFHLLPNGIFYINENGRAGVLETGAFLSKSLQPKYATQSGPMLLIDGAIHPRFLPSSTSRKIRNGVGIAPGGAVVFVKSETPVTFYKFAQFFADEIGAKNALYLDGTISRLYDTGLGRNDDGFPMGPIVGVVTKTTPDAQPPKKD